ncbi:hypothetical protein [Actinacidiphila acididurans]|uniref:Secreted protein n=1 Tax=Actinacidiphila acididurans TaxID=2784346 RepID=A0ABS2U4W5_9ACTN|nr:hypothetical protein [Actinacidiphila acididurans]MBM9510663.1 hypothetical protein [Actinacidiphila acididurans]
MAITRTRRVLAVLGALPVAAVLFAGTAAADDGAFAGGHSTAGVVRNAGGNFVGGANSGNVTSTQQAANGAGASNQNNNAGVVGSGFTAIRQDNINVRFTQLW